MVRKRRKMRWNRMIITLIVIILLIFGLYKMISLVFTHNKIQNENVKNLVDKIDEAIPTVIIDPGHGGIDAGAKNGKLYEKDIALKTSFAIGDALKEKNIKVIYTRTTDEPLHEDKATDLNMRADMSKTYNADFYVSIHVNDFDGNTHPSGFEIYVKNDQSKALASSIGQYMKALKYSKNRGILDGSDLAVLRRNTVPSVLIELGYIRDADYAYLKDDKKLNQLAIAISQGIIEQVKEKISNK